MRLMTTLRWNASQTLRGLLTRRGDFSMGVALAGLALALPFFLGCVWFSLDDISIEMPRTEITVFTERSASLPTVKKAQAAIADLAGVAETRILTRDKAMELVNQSLGLKDRTDRTDATNTLPDIIIVTLGANMSADATAQLATEIKAVPGVVSTAFDAKWAENLAAFRSAILSIAAILAVVIILLLILVITNSIQMTTRAQNEEIRALNTFGADTSFIASPYGWRGAITMLLASLISAAVGWVGVGLLAEPAAKFAAIYRVDVALTMPRPDYLCLYFFACAFMGYVIGRATAHAEIRRVQSAQTF